MVLTPSFTFLNKVFATANRLSFLTGDFKIVGSTLELKSTPRVRLKQHDYWNIDVVCGLIFSRTVQLL